MNIMKSWIKNL